MGCEVDRGRTVALRFLPTHQVEQRPHPVEAFDRLGVQMRATTTSLMACLSDVFCCHAELAVQGLAQDPDDPGRDSDSGHLRFLLGRRRREIRS